MNREKKESGKTRTGFSSRLGRCRPGGERKASFAVTPVHNWERVESRSSLRVLSKGKEKWNIFPDALKPGKGLPF